tara:strand:+ start:8967 stop:9959 length:993 start_codon:yes stop_codon:yes gene_type:complete
MKNCESVSAEHVSKVECVACRFAPLSEGYQVVDTNQGVNGEWSLFVCPQCGGAQLEPLPSHDELAQFYNASFYNSEGARFRPWLEVLRRKLGLVRSWHLKGLSAGVLLDFGCGPGHFARAMKVKNWEVIMIDPYNVIAEHNDLCEIVDGRLRLDLPDCSVDCITLWHVIEHLPYPHQYLQELTRLLRPNGKILLSQPNYASLQAGFFGQDWLLLDPPRHLFQFTPKGLGILMSGFGFEQVYRSNNSLELGPFTILQSILNKFFGDSNLLFNTLKSGKVRTGKFGECSRIFRLITYLILVPFFGCVAFLLYAVLLMVSSGDVVTLIYQKND